MGFLEAEAEFLRRSGDRPIRMIHRCRLPIALLAVSAMTLYGKDKPTLPDNFIARPEFIIGESGFGAGTGFFLESSAANTGFIITAHHLFGPLGGLDKDIHPKNLKNVVSSIRMTGIINPWSRVFQVRPIPVRDDPGLTSENPFYDKHVDLAVFAIKHHKDIHWGTLSRDSLKVGEIAWQAGEPRYGQAQGEWLHSCRIIRMAKGHGFCLFDNQELVLGGTSGSPYVNSKGEVLGLHSGSTKEPGKLTGIILLAEVIRRNLPESGR